MASPLSKGERDAAVALLAVAMGMQNAVARHLAVPDLTTTVLTMTGIASDLRHRQYGASLLRRLLAVASMSAGVVVGGVLVVHQSTTAALGVGSAVLAAVVAASWFDATARNAVE